MHEEEILGVIEGRRCFAERRRRRGGRGLCVTTSRKPAKRGGNINMKNHYVSVAEEGKNPHRQLYK